MSEEVSAAEKIENAARLDILRASDAMAQSFQGTGHWYYCANGHPFTVGDRGMPMETGVSSVGLLWVGPTINLQMGLGGQKTWKRSMGGEGGRSR